MHVDPLQAAAPLNPTAHSSSGTGAAPARYDEAVGSRNLNWQSTLIVLLVLPASVANLVLQVPAWLYIGPLSVLYALGLSGLLGILAWRSRSATPAAAAAGAVLTAVLMLSTAVHPYHPWQNALVPVLAVLLLSSFSTRFGRARKQALGTAEKHSGREPSQVAANVGLAALIIATSGATLVSDWLGVSHRLIWILGLAALAEAAADTVSSELGQVLGGQPRMITTLRPVPPGTDGGITFAGTAAGTGAAAIVAAAGALALAGGWTAFLISWAGGVFGLLFDSVLGATLERGRWLNNDAVNFLSTVSAAALALMLIRP